MAEIYLPAVPICFRGQVGAAVSRVFGIFFLFGIGVFAGEWGGFRETENWESLKKRLKPRKLGLGGGDLASVRFRLLPRPSGRGGFLCVRNILFVWCWSFRGGGRGIWEPENWEALQNAKNRGY